MLAVLPLVSLFAVAAPPVIPPADAAKHVGQEVIVQGTIDQIATTVNLTTHINMGGSYPNFAFTCTIFKAKQPLFRGVKDLQGKLVQVQGVVRLYRNKPEIVLEEPGQLRAVAAGGAAPEGTTAAPAAAAAAAAPQTGLSSLSFEAKGADFAAWVGHFGKAVNEQWRVPDAGLVGGARGTAEFEFVVERDGAMSAIRLLKSSGTTSLDRAAAKALSSSRFLPLPPDYPDQNVMMRVGFVYGDGMK